MKVIRARVLGFCMGVRRAVEIALRVSENKGTSQVFTLGPLIHNKSVLQMLEKRGVICLEEKTLKKAPQGSTVIIRAHGISPLVERSLKEQGLNVLDATCPNVKTSQNKVKAFAEKGYPVFLAGEENHAEIAGLRGYVDGMPYFVVGKPAAAEAAATELYRKEASARTALVGQTTISPEEYKAISQAILKIFPGTEIVNSICYATSERQEAMLELCAQVEALIIAGDRESANTRRLLALALDLGKPAWLVESPADLPCEIWNYKTVGLSAGASTPDSLIDEIEEVLTVNSVTVSLPKNHQESLPGLN